MSFDGLMCDLSSMALMSDAKTRSICGENRTGEKSGGAHAMPPVDENGKPVGPARALGQGWKVHPCDGVKPGETFLMADQIHSRLRKPRQRVQLLLAHAVPQAHQNNA